MQLKTGKMQGGRRWELKLSNNGGIDAATQQIRDKQYAEPFKADKRRVVALAIELDDQGKGLVDWKEA